MSFAQILVDTARDFAEKAHAGQMYGNIDYFSGHVEKVALSVKFALHHDHEFARLATACAYLHDVVEDTDTTLDAIETMFGLDVRNVVDLLTEPERPLGSPAWVRRERFEAWSAKWSRLSSGFTEEVVSAATVVKVADRLVNVRACWASKDKRLFMYRDEQGLLENTLLPYAGNPTKKAFMVPNLTELRICLNYQPPIRTE